MARSKPRKKKKISDAEKYRREMQGYRSQFKNMPKKHMTEADVEVARELDSAYVRDNSSPLERIGFEIEDI